MIDRLVEGMMASVHNSRAEGCRHTEKHRRWGVDDQWIWWVIKPTGMMIRDVMNIANTLIVLF
jgi:hypothetical protein